MDSQLGDETAATKGEAVMQKYRHFESMLLFLKVGLLFPLPRYCFS